MLLSLRKSLLDKIVATVDKATKDGKVYIFLTVSGGYFSSLIFILFIISLSYGNSLAYLCSFLFLSVIWVSCIVTNYNLYGLDIIRMQMDDYYIAGEEVNVHIHYKNIGKKTRFDIEVSFLKGESNFTLEAPPGVTKELMVRLPLSKAGVYSFKKMDLRTTFPFGLFRSWKPFSLKGEVLVIPKPVPHPFPSEQREIDSEGELRVTTQREEFLEHNRYSNQEASRVDWKVYARRGELYFKEFDSASRKLYQLNPEGDPSHLCYLLLEAEKSDALYSLEGIVPLGRGREQLLRCLKEVVKR